MASVILILFTQTIADFAIAGNVNIARQKPTAQISESSGGHHSRAVDGNRNQVFSNWGCTHTWKGTKVWWAVDLGKEYRIHEVKIWNRSDCCGSRLQNVTIDVTQAVQNGLSGDTVWDSLDPVVCAHYPGVASNGDIISFKCETCIMGRYVRVWKYDLTQEPLTMCEVEVYGELAKVVSMSPVIDQFAIHTGGDLYLTKRAEYEVESFFHCATLCQRDSLCDKYVVGKQNDGALHCSTWCDYPNPQQIKLTPGPQFIVFNRCIGNC